MIEYFLLTVLINGNVRGKHFLMSKLCKQIGSENRVYTLDSEVRTRLVSRVQIRLVVQRTNSISTPE